MLREFNPDASPASYALRFAASLDNVFMVLSGMNTMEQVLDNTSVFDNLTPLNEDEKEILEKVIKIIEKSIEIPCTSCGYCMSVRKTYLYHSFLVFTTTIKLTIIFQTCTTTA